MSETEITDQVISKAANELTDTIALALGKLADQILGRPEFGSPEWSAWLGTRNTPEGQAGTREWHLVKLRISREAKVDPTGDVINARKFGATWAQIGEACGMTRQGAQDRWAKHTDAKGNAK
jgi:hypothetical protein